jgi:hypothetical protein
MAKSPKKPKKKPAARPDVNQLAFRIVQEATGQAPKTPDPNAGKDAKAVARGKKGGTKGGIMRAASMSPERRTEVARKAAKARWAKRPPSEA